MTALTKLACALVLAGGLSGPGFRRDDRHAQSRLGRRTERRQ